MAENKWISKPLYGREGIGVLKSQNYSNFDQFIKATKENFGKDNKTGEYLGKSIY